MFYFFYEYFDVNIFKYISVRAGLGFFVAFILTLWLTPKFIKFSIMQPICDFAPTSHQDKQNTPTMGGVVFVCVSLLCIALFCNLSNIYVLISFVLIGGLFVIGFLDDYLKIANKDNAKALSARVKFVLQCVVALVVGGLLFYNSFSTELFVPFYKSSIFDMGIFSILFWTFLIVGTSNGVNLTDGLDGLATVPSIFSLFTLALLCYVVGNAIISSYLLLPNIKDSGELAIVAISFCGALFGFLWFNSHPAQIFMGDSGSLVLGGLIAYLAIVSKNEVLLILIGFIFLVETLSVILQLGSLKTRGKKIFLMSPIHHHFEQKGQKESKIIVRFWIVAFISNMLALLSVKIR